MSFSACLSTNDQSIGPNVRGCRDDFDFTVKFEQLFFSLTPSAVFIALSIWRFVVLTRRPVIVDALYLWLGKLGAILSYALLELALLILVGTRSINTTGSAISAFSLRFSAAVCIIPLSFLENSRSPRPSVLLSAYLSLTLLFDIAQVRTFWLVASTRPEIVYTAVFTTAFAIKIIVVLLEAQRKTRWIKWDVKSHSPEETSGIYSLGLYSWLNRLAISGYRKVLQIPDLYPLDTTMTATQLHERFIRNFNSSGFKGYKHRLVLVLARTLMVQLLLPIPARIALIGFTLSQPFFINSLLKYLAEPPTTAPANIGYGFIGASILIYSGIALSTALYWYFQQRMLYMTRGSLVSAIYAKTIVGRTTTGDENASLTLMSADIERINQGFRSLHEIWANTVQVAVAAFLLYGQLGPAFVVPIVIVLLCGGGILIPIKFTARGQRLWMDQLQKRVGLTSSVIASMKNLKISGLAIPITSFVQQLRIDELSASTRFRRLILASATLAFIPLLTSPFFTFAIAQRTLDAARLYTSLSYLLLMTQPLSQLFQTFPLVVGGLACLGRIQLFLESEDRHDYRVAYSNSQTTPEKGMVTTDTQGAVISIRNGSFGWSPGQMVLNDINVNIRSAALTMIVGPIASGKSSFCKALLGEIPYSHGKLTIDSKSSRVGYCDQIPFLSNGSIRDNIVGFSPFDAARYAEVIDATLLGTDFQTLPGGDSTSIGSNGITLSGGQKQRVSLARTLYLQADLLICDDVFSGLDADTEDQVFNRVFGSAGLVRRRGVSAVLCTHSVRHLPTADHIVALGLDGRVIEQGTFDDLNSNKSYVRGLDIRSYSASGSSVDGENKSESENIPVQVKQVTGASTLPELYDGSRQTGDFAVYRIYFKSMGLGLASLLFLFGISLGFFYNFPTVWLSFWALDAAKTSPSHTNGYYVGIYALLQILALFSLMALAFLLFLTGISRSGASLHQTALNTVVHAPLRFFTTTDQGTITNLFSQDLNLIDNELPNSLLNTIVDVFVAIGQAVVIAAYAPYLAIAYPFVGALLYTLQRFYLRTSRQLRLLDLEAKSPLYTHFLDTVKGIVTLRAFGFIDENRSKNFHLLDTSQRPAYLLVMIQQWLAVVLNFIVAVIAVLLTILATQLRSNSGITGASLVTLMSLGESLSGIILSYTQLETSIGAIGRLKTFSDNVKPEEQDREDICPPNDWPQRGEISLKGVSATYSDDKEDEKSILALKDINLCVQSGEKVAICGRTGSGKSSLIALLLKLLEPLPSTAESVHIDNIALERLDRITLRQRIIAVPQDVVFLPDGSTFFTNLDPFQLATQEDAESVAKIVGLWDFITDQGGLEAGMIAGIFSQGQRQLFSLARAVLRRRIRARSLGLGGCGSEGGILLLDEVSSSVDQETEKKMQEVIRDEFKNYTIIAVSHRLDMVMDFDRVVVMDKGAIVEIGNPAQLAKEPGTRFGDLYAVGGY
ncbi:putative ABC multidrug transporter [Xylariaceae sp. FL1651]|nr:putative ABC multidrug transporter [Xylariaceae sp. FL1651]